MLCLCYPLLLQNSMSLTAVLPASSVNASLYQFVFCLTQGKQQVGSFPNVSSSKALLCVANLNLENSSLEASQPGTLIFKMDTHMQIEKGVFFTVAWLSDILFIMLDLISCSSERRIEYFLYVKIILNYFNVSMSSIIPILALYVAYMWVFDQTMTQKAVQIQTNEIK